MSDLNKVLGPLHREGNLVFGQPNDLVPRALAYLYDDNGRREANMRLFLAAPELLDACRDAALILRRVCDLYPFAEACEVANRLGQILVKVETGEV